MANILCVYENKIATVASLENFFQELQKYDSRVKVDFLPIHKITNRIVDNYDILCMIRPNNSIFGRMAKVARKQEIKIIFFLDDDLLNLPKDNANMGWRRRGLILSVTNSDIILSSSEYICTNYSRISGINRCVILDTAVFIKDIKRHIEGINDRLKIVYAAGISHKDSFDRFLTPIITKLDEKYGDQISLTFMGVHPILNVDKLKMPVRYIDAMPLNEYRLRIKEENFDIGLAPLVANEFTKCKYFNKFIEYSMFGIVGLYSNVEPYTFVIKNDINGWLVDNNSDDWFNALSLVINNRQKISLCRENVYKTLNDRFNEKVIMDKFIENIPEILEEHRKRNVQGVAILFFKFIYLLSRLGDWIFKMAFYFKRGGVSEVIKGIKRHIKTLV